MLLIGAGIPMNTRKSVGCSYTLQLNMIPWATFSRNSSIDTIFASLNCDFDFHRYSEYLFLTKCYQWQWNGRPLFSMWEISSCMCRVFTTSHGSWSWIVTTDATWCPGCSDIPHSPPYFISPSDVRASRLFPWGDNVKFQTTSFFHSFDGDIFFILLLWQCIKRKKIKESASCVSFCRSLNFRFGMVLASRAIRAAHCLTSIQVG